MYRVEEVKDIPYGEYFLLKAGQASIAEVYASPVGSFIPSRVQVTPIRPERDEPHIDRMLKSFGLGYHNWRVRLKIGKWELGIPPWSELLHITGDLLKSEAIARDLVDELSERILNKDIFLDSLSEETAFHYIGGRGTLIRPGTKYGEDTTVLYGLYEHIMPMSDELLDFLTKTKQCEVFLPDQRVLSKEGNTLYMNDAKVVADNNMVAVSGVIPDYLVELVHRITYRHITRTIGKVTVDLSAYYIGNELVLSITASKKQPVVMLPAIYLGNCSSFSIEDGTFKVSSRTLLQAMHSPTTTHVVKELSEYPTEIQDAVYACAPQLLEYALVNW